MPVALTRESIEIIIDNLQYIFNECADEDHLFTEFVDYMEGEGVINLIKG